MNSNEYNIKKMQSLAIKAAATASKYIMEMWNRYNCSIKKDGSIVTDVDISAELIIRNILNKGSPSIDIFGEESNDFKANSDRFWLIDPIDGTRWYTLGVPIFGSLIALVEDGEPVLGVISIPATQEIMYAAINNGCYYSRGKNKPKQVFVTQTNNINESLISTSGLHGSDVWLENGEKPYYISKLPHLSKSFYFTGDCLQHLLVARGKLNAAIDTIMKPWDIAAIIPCIREAKGYVCALDGKTNNFLNQNSLLSSSSKVLAEKIIEAITPTI